MPAPLALPIEDTPATKGHRRRPWWALAIVVVGVAAVAVALVVGISGLTADPVKSHNTDGTTTLQGSFEPYQCSAALCNGYVQAGARSVFVQFPARCPEPARGSTITVTGRPAPDLGSAAYRATTCA
jgi:hypothetical protein